MYGNDPLQQAFGDMHNIAPCLPCTWQPNQVAQITLNILFFKELLTRLLWLVGIIHFISVLIFNYFHKVSRKIPVSRCPRSLGDLYVWFLNKVWMANEPNAFFEVGLEQFGFVVFHFSVLNRGASQMVVQLDRLDRSCTGFILRIKTIECWNVHPWTFLSLWRNMMPSLFLVFCQTVMKIVKNNKY